MAVTPAAVANTVLFTPGIGGLIGGGCPQLAATVLGIDATGLILDLRVMPPDRDPDLPGAPRRRGAGRRCLSKGDGGARRQQVGTGESPGGRSSNLSPTDATAAGQTFEVR